jgi:hypothetical protein
MKKLVALAMAAALLCLFGCGGAPDAPKPGPERELGSAIAWEPPGAEGSTQLELPEFPGVVFSNEYNENGGFSWDVFVKAISRDGEKRMFDFGLGPNSVFINDVTGDGYPDFVYMTSWTSGLFTLGVNVYDYVNDAHYFLGGYGNANGIMIENGRLMVARYNADGPVGELAMVDGELVITDVEKQKEFTINGRSAS